jgi:tetratricopeptide (TPR) repeat protein
MLKKSLIILSIVVVVVCIPLGFHVYDLYKAYNIPPIAESVTIKDLNIDFEDEVKIASLKTHAKNVTIAPDEVNENNVEDAFHYSRDLIKDRNYKKASELLLEVIRVDPNQLIYINELRIVSLKLNKTEDFLIDMKSMPQTYELKINKALAYIDHLQTPGLGTANLGQKSAQSIEVLNEIIKENEHDLLAHYARGLNNLYWPSGLRRTDKAIQDLTYCVAVEKKFGGNEFPFWALFYEALGDALVKDGQIKEGIQVWKQGFEKYPQSSELKKRQDLDDKKAFQIVKQVRGIDGFQRPDKSITDLNLIWSN